MQILPAWDSALSIGSSLSILRTVALKHCNDASLPHDHPLYVAIENRDWLKVIGYEISYDENWDTMSLIHVRQAQALFSKLEPLPLQVDKEEVAVSKFMATEESCRELNKTLSMIDCGKLISMLPQGVRLIERARRKIYRILGSVPSLSELPLAFGPGATTSVKRSESCPANKFAGGLKCSFDLYASGLLPGLLRELPHWTAALDSSWSVDDDGWLVEWHDVEIVPGKLEFVPKNAKTYRSICVEPVLNGLLQKGIGKYMERRLRSFGLDIRDQTANRRLARRGSLERRVATLDLSSASDLISTQLVKMLLPPEWFTLLSAARTSHVTYKGESLFLEKFSGMGNGFTFPLETLIFYAITSSACDGVLGEDLGVYGDDIVCPVETADRVMWALTFCGFSVNEEKSFYRGGPFCESCGHDYYKGVNVRPYYQKDLVDGVSLFAWHNHYKRLGLDEYANLVRGFIPRDMRIYGPDGYGDGHLVSEVYPRVYKPTHLERGYGGYCFETYTFESPWRTPRHPGDWVSPLYSTYIGAGRDFSCKKSKHGYPLWGLPGRSGYNRTLIYTLRG